MRRAHGPQLLRVELDVVVGVDDLVRPAERQAVGGPEDDAAAGTRHAGGLGDGICRVRDVLEAVRREHGVEAAVEEGQPPHVGADNRAVLPAQRGVLDVDADRRARRKQIVAVAHSAPEVERPARREEPLDQGVLRGVSLPGRVEAPDRLDVGALSGYGSYLLHRTIPNLWRRRRPAAARVLSP